MAETSGVATRARAFIEVAARENSWIKGREWREGRERGGRDPLEPFPPRSLYFAVRQGASCARTSGIGKVASTERKSRGFETSYTDDREFMILMASEYLNSSSLSLSRAGGIFSKYAQVEFGNFPYNIFRDELIYSTSSSDNIWLINVR